jgi:hypothetical protein
MTRSDLIPLLRTVSRVSEVLTGKRELSMTGEKATRAVSHSSRCAHPDPYAVRSRRMSDDRPIRAENAIAGCKEI